MAATLAATVFFTKPRLSFNKILEGSIVMAAPTQKEALDSEKIKGDVKKCLASLREFLLKGNRTDYDAFSSLWKEYRMDQPYDKLTGPDKAKNDLFWNSFAAKGGFNSVIRSGATKKLEEQFKQHYYEANPAMKGKGYPLLEFADAMLLIYDSFLNKDIKAGKLLKEKYGDAFFGTANEQYLKAHPEKSRETPSNLVPVKVPLPIKVKEDDLKTFLEFFGVKGALADANHEERIRGLVVTMIPAYGLKNFKEASSMAAGLLHTYSRLDDNGKKQFLLWLSKMKDSQKKTLGSHISSVTAAMGPTLPYDIVKKDFDSWKESQISKKERIYQLEVELKETPWFIRNRNIYDKQKAFLKKPGDELLWQMGLRVAYLRNMEKVLKLKDTPGSRLELKKVEHEISHLNRWLKTLGIQEKTPELGLSKLRAGLLSVQVQYYTLTKNNLQLAKTLEKVQNKRLGALLTKYVSLLDLSSGRLFTDIKASDPAYASRIRQAISSSETTSKIDRGREIWISEYYPLITPSRSTLGSTPTDIANYALAATLTPGAAIALVDYVKVAKDSGLDGSLARKMVPIVAADGTVTYEAQTVDTTGVRTMIANTVSKLNSLSPSLTARYLNAIRHIAEICEDNTDAFRGVMLETTAYINASVDAVMSRTSPGQIQSMNIIELVSGFESYFNELGNIEKSSVAQFDRFNLFDERLKRWQYAPNALEQMTPGYEQNLLAGESTVGGIFTPYPFPHSLLTPVPGGLFSGGSVFTAQPTYGGGLTLPTFRPLSVYTSVGAVKSSTHAYLYPTHQVVSINRYLPGVNISGVSATKLLNEVRRAAISTKRKDYSAVPIAGGMAAGVTGMKTGEEWEIGGGGLGSLITPSGGYAIGGLRESGRTFGGASALAVPIGTVRGKEVTLDSATAGVESFDDSQMKIIGRAISTQWDPKNPSQMLIVVNSDKTISKELQEGQVKDVNKWYTTARVLYVEKDGTIYDLTGGQNDLVSVLNFFAGYVDKSFNTPATFAWNVEPSIKSGEGETTKRGGGALVFDVGKMPFLFHAQALPFFQAEDTPQPFLMQYTVALAHTSESGPRTQIMQLAFPGQMLKLESEGNEEKYYVQEVDFMLRRVEKLKAWELRLGGAYADTPLGSKGKAGVFLKTQTPTRRLGGGLYYEAGATRLTELAMMSQAEEAKQYILSLHRIAETVYGSKKLASQMTVGALIHVVQQLKEEKEKGTKYDTTFWRMVGVLSGLKSAARLEVKRISGMDQMLAEYQKRASQIGQNPATAATLVSDFQNRYAEQISQVFDHYFLGIQINKNFSLEASLIAQEKENTWTSQMPDTVYARSLLTWKSGFWRTFVAMPLLVPAGGASASGSQTVGIAGTGVGFDMFSSFWAQRMAMDGGLIVARMETGATATELNSWTKAGFFAQGALALYSNVLDDSKKYRRLRQTYDSYKSYISSGKLSLVPPWIRAKLVQGLDPKIFPPETIKRIRDGNNVKLESAQARDLQDSLWRNWFYDKKFELNQKFDGHMRAIIAGGAYAFLGDKTYWDIGAFVEHVDRMKAYIILAKRDKYSLYLGAEVTKGRIRAAAAGGLDFAPANIAGAASVGYKFFRGGLPMEAGLMGYGRSSTVPDYTAPMYYHEPYTSNPEFGAMIYFMIGGGGVPMFQDTGAQTPSLYQRRY